MKTIGMTHQLQAMSRLQGKRNFGLFMEQGTGKTWTTLADAERCYMENKIDALLVFAPNGVHTNWVRREMPTHLSCEWVAYAWRGKPTTKKARAEFDKLYQDYPVTKTPPLRVLTINFEAVNTAAGLEVVMEFIRSFRVMAVVDESTRIKNPQAKRTKKIIEACREATARRILTGTPMPKDPSDLYSQFDFLKEGLLGTTSFRAFMRQYAILLDPEDPKMKAILRRLNGAPGIPQVVAEDENGNKQWKNLDRLSDMMQPHVFRVKKEDCLDLPPKVYKRISFELSSAQKKVYDRLDEEHAYLQKMFVDAHITENPEATFEEAVEYFHAHSFEGIAARSKMKQVTSGFINIDGEAILMPEEDNPRLQIFKSYIEDREGQFLVWCLYEAEILQVAESLRKLGFRTATYYGATKKENKGAELPSDMRDYDRETIVDEYQNGNIDVIVGHAAAMGIGLTLTRGELSVYYSCDSNNELRLQSEDRNHRIGTKNVVVYLDLIAEDTVDEKDEMNRRVKTETAAIVIDRKNRND